MSESSNVRAREVLDSKVARIDSVDSELCVAHIGDKEDEFARICRSISSVERSLAVMHYLKVILALVPRGDIPSGVTTEVTFAKFQQESLNNPSSNKEGTKLAGLKG